MYYDDYTDEFTDYDYLNYKTSQEMLEAQLETNQQLRQLRNQINQGNLVNQQILQNQIRDIEERETQNFYKSRVFKIGQLISSINNCQDVDQKAFLYIVLYDTIQKNLSDSINVLNEIHDKEYCAKMFDDFSKSKNLFLETNTFSIGQELAVIQNGKDEYTSLCNRIAQLRKQMKDIDSACLVAPNEGNPYLIKLILIAVVAVFLLFFMRGIFYGIIRLLLVLGLGGAAVLFYKNYVKYAEIEKDKSDYIKMKKDRVNRKNNVDKEINDTKSLLENCQYTQAINSLTKKFPSWNSVLAESRRYLAE